MPRTAALLLCSSLTALLAACDSSTETSTGSTTDGAGGEGAQTSTGGAGGEGAQTSTGAAGEGGMPLDDCEPISLDGMNQVVTLPMGCPSPTCTATGLTPLDELGTGDFFGVPGGLYCGANQRPPLHDARGATLASAIEPRAGDGTIDAQNGRVVLVSIGMSNTNQEFGEFISTYGNRPELHDRLTIINGALGGQASEAWAETEVPWTNLDNVLATASLTPAQVAVVWIKQTHLEGYSVCGGMPPFNGPVPCFPRGAKKLYDNMVVILQRLATTFPNLAIAYLSGRVYGGYNNGGPSPEAFAYASSFGMKALILDQISGNNPALAEPTVPWLAWGPYLWADGLTPRASDGLMWELSDFQMDGIHPAATGRAKVADMLWGFLTTDTAATPWFLE